MLVRGLAAVDRFSVLVDGGEGGGLNSAAHQQRKRRQKRERQGDRPSSRADPAVVEHGVARIEDQLERRTLDVIQQFEGVQMRKPAVVHAVFMAVDDTVVLADLDQLIDFGEDDLFKFRTVGGLVLGREKTHAADQFDAEFPHPGDGGQK